MLVVVQVSYSHRAWFVAENSSRNLSEGLCRQLQILWLGDNDITKFPEDVAKMPTLQRLSLSYAIERLC